MGPIFKLWKGSRDLTFKLSGGPGVQLLNLMEVPGPTFKL